MSAPAPSPTRALAERAAGYRWHALPADVRERILFAVRDALACAAGGSGTDLARLHLTALGLSGAAEATVIGAGQRAPAAAAAYHNATATNAMDYDDTARHSGHPGSAVVSAALAAAERTGASGAAFLEAVVAGYEVALAIAAACRPSPAQYDLVHGSGSFLAMGTAVAAGRVQGLDAEGLARAMGIAGPISPIPGAGKFGFDEPQLSWIKDNVNWPAEAGVRAALLASAGFPASRTYLDGDRGFWRMVASDRFDPALLGEADTFHVRELAFKPYPCCRWLHAALDATTLALSGEARRDPDEIAAIRIHSTRAVAAVFGNRRPTTMVDAQFSAPHAVAALVLALPFVDWWRPEHRASDAMRRLMDRIELAEDPALTEAFLRDGRNVNRLPAQITVRFRDGRERAAFCDDPMGTPGQTDPDARLREAEHFAAKHRALFGLLLDAAGVDVLTAALAALPAAATVDAIVRPLAGLGPS
jgi:2-methylcitrate dehydratase PrpD